MVAERVLWATGSTVGCWAGCKILDRVRDVMGWAEGVGCAGGVGGVSWGALDGTLGASCVARRCSIHLSLSKADGRRSHLGDGGAGSCPGRAASSAGAWTTLQALMASSREWRATIWLSTLDVGIPCSAVVRCWMPRSTHTSALTDGWVRC